jgi:hypothetical protein
MRPEDLVVPPPTPKIIDYPGTVGIGICIIFTTVLLFVSDKFDVTNGPLTISLLVVLGFLGVVTLCVFYTIPTDETTSMVIGGLTAAFGAIISYWLSRPPRGPQ